MTLSPNLTDEHMEAVMNALPEEMSDAELCALVLTMYCAFVDDTPSIMGSLVSAIYCLGETRGMTRATVSKGLRMMADLHDKPQTKPTAH
jgi:hypothetical protein